ncbi:MAG: glycosyltransferase family 4 protein [Prevotella sp.]|nr:glycosyltransferase family 4 protein [Prevotella sp.]MBR6188673.1 glycosyltransferase family 4 protein [Prevotella sp.]
MKVLVVSFYYPPEMGAAPSRISNMAEGLLAEGTDVDVLTCLPNYPKGRIFDDYRHCFSKRETLNGINVFRYWTYATVSKNPVARLLSMLVFAIDIWLFGLKFWRIRHYDRVIVQTPPLPIGFSAMLLFRCLYRKTTVLNVSDLWPTSAIELGAVKEGSTNHKVLACMEKFVYKKASAYQGQSQEIIDHIERFGYHKPHFLYRNLQPAPPTNVTSPSLPIHSPFTPLSFPPRTPLRLVYAGLLGVAQDILGLVQAIDFKALGVELHIYGGGNQAEAIEDYVKSHDCGITCHGYKTKEEINQVLGTYHASIVPLVVPIKGAVPSKIFDLLPHGTPVIFCGGGEGENIVRDYRLGLVSSPGDYQNLTENITLLRNMSDEDYLQLRINCLQAATGEFSFSEQIKKYYAFLKTIK